MDSLTNRFKAALAEGRQQIGLWCRLASPIPGHGTGSRARSVTFPGSRRAPRNRPTLGRHKSLRQFRPRPLIAVTQTITLSVARSWSVLRSFPLTMTVFFSALTELVRPEISSCGDQIAARSPSSLRTSTVH